MLRTSFSKTTEIALVDHQLPHLQQFTLKKSHPGTPSGPEPEQKKISSYAPHAVLARNTSYKY